MNATCSRCGGYVDAVTWCGRPDEIPWCKCVPRASTPEELYRLAVRQLERKGKEIRRLRARLKGRGETIRRLVEELDEMEWRCVNEWITPSREKLQRMADKAASDNLP